MELLDKQLPCNLMTIVLHDTKIMEILMTFLAIMSNGCLHAIQFPIVIERFRAGGCSDIFVSQESAKDIPKDSAQRVMGKKSAATKIIDAFQDQLSKCYSEDKD